MMSGINPIVADHFEMLFRDVLNEELNKRENRHCFYHEFFIFMAVVMEGNIGSVVGVDAFRCNNGTAEIATDVFGNDSRVTFGWHGTDIEAISAVPIYSTLYSFERRTNVSFHLA